MDQHPIPQDVTGFQFKLVGSMTVKQFGYVAAGVISAVVFYYMPLPGPFFLVIMTKLILIPLFGGSGFAIAFVPVEGRPIDVMATHFAKAIFSPNQYIYHKMGRQFSFSTVSLPKLQPVTTATKTMTPRHAESARKTQQLQALLQSSHTRPSNAIDQRESAFLKTLNMIPSNAPATSTPALHPAQIAHPVTPTTPIHKAVPTVVAPAPQPLPVQPAPVKAIPVTPPTTAAQPNKPVEAKPVQPQPVEKPSEEELAKEETMLEQELKMARQVEATNHAPAEVASAHQKVQMLEQQVQDIHQQKQQLEQELIQLKTQLHTTQELQSPAKPLLTQAPAPVVNTPAPAAVPAPAVAAAPVAPTNAPQPQGDQSHVHTIPQNVINKAGLPHVPDTANVVVGIVKDPRGNILPNILVEVKDKEGNPVRAFKTNPLGQFASATPLSTGVYTIELEDPKKQHNFDVVQIAANNQIMLPIEIISHDAREELRKQLFTN